MTTFCLSAVAAFVGWALIDRPGLASVSPLIAAVGIILGIPHGAVDHLVPSLVSRRWLSPTHLAVVVGVYVAVAAVAAVALLRAPDISFAVFLVVSALHFGWAETTFAAERNGDPVPRLRHRWREAVVHGSIIVVLPLWSPEGRSAMRPLLPNLVDWVTAIPSHWAVSVIVLACSLTAARLVADRRVLAAVELIAVLTLFLIVPVFAAFGVYFGLWHAVRHTTRLMDAFAGGQPMHVQLMAFTRAAVLPTVAAVIVLTLLFASRFHAGVVMTGISMLLALTFPHVVAVAVLDHYRRVNRQQPSQSELER